MVISVSVKPSISLRTFPWLPIILGSLAEGESSFENILISGDTAATIEIFRSLGVKIDLIDENIIKTHGVGLNGLDEPEHDLDAKSSGTTARLLIGLLSRQNFSSRMVGSNQLMKRPMARVIDLFTDNGEIGRASCRERV